MQAIVAGNAVAFSRTLARSPSLATAVLDVGASRDAPDLIFRRLEEDRGGRDTLVYPLVFLWRHAIELQLQEHHRAGTDRH